MKYYFRTLLITLTFVCTLSTTLVRGAEFIPLNFELGASQRWLWPAGLSDDGTTVFGVTGRNDDTLIWTEAEGGDNITRTLRRQTLSSVYFYEAWVIVDFEMTFIDGQVQ